MADSVSVEFPNGVLMSVSAEQAGQLSALFALQGATTRGAAGHRVDPGEEAEEAVAAAEPVDGSEHVAAPAVPVGVPVGAPAGNASRGDWAVYAESLGVEPGDMTRNELKAAVAAL